MSNAYIYRMPSGIAGDVTRREHAKIESHVIDADTPPLRFGEPVKLVSGKIQPMAQSDTEQPYGFLVRPYPGMTASSEALGTAKPSTSLIADVLVSGYMTVDNYSGTPAIEGQVYYYNGATHFGKVTAGPAGSPVDNIAITGCLFMGAADSDGNVEIKFNV